MLCNYTAFRKMALAWTENLASSLPVIYRVSQENVLCLINKKTTAFCSVFKISFVLDRLNSILDFDISFLKIGKKLTELRELEDKNAVNHEIKEIF